MLKKIVGYILPPETSRRRLVGAAARKTKLIGNKHPDIHYAEWVERTEPFTWSKIKSLDFEPLISIVVPVFNPPAKYLLPMVYSVVNQQGYDNWELILVNASTDKDSQLLTKNCADIDNRVRVVDVQNNSGIAGNTNAGIDNSKGQYIAILDHDDLLAPRALFEVALTLQAEPRPKFIYSDEDKISEKNTYRFDPFLKPDWSPYLFCHVNYLNHLVVVEKKLIEEVGGYRTNFEGAQDYDLFLRLTDKKPTIAHIPKILYHWRSAIGSTAKNFETKKGIRDAGIVALNEHLERTGRNGRASHLAKQPGFYNISYTPRDKDKLAILLLPSPITHQYKYAAESLISYVGNTDIKTDVFINLDKPPIVPDNDSNVSIHSVRQEDEQKFIKESIDQTKADIVLFVNAAIEPLKDKWLEELVGIVAHNPNIGVASPVLVNKASKIIVDAGFVKQGNRNIALFDGLPIKSNTYLGNTIWGRNISQTSNRINVMRMDVYKKYFANEYPTVNEGDDIFKKLSDDKLETIVCMNNPMHFEGDIRINQGKSRYYNQNLLDSRRGVSLPKTINVPPGRG